MMACYRNASMLMHASIAITDAASALAEGDIGTVVASLLQRSVALSIWALLEEIPKMHSVARRRKRAKAATTRSGAASQKLEHKSRNVKKLGHGGLRPQFGFSRPVVFIIVLLAAAIWAGVALAQIANSNAGLHGGQDGLFDAILATPNHRTPVPQDDIFGTAPGAEQAARIPQFTLNVLAPAFYNSNAQLLNSGGSQALEGSPVVRLGWASQLFDTPIRISGAASLETERFTNAAGAAIDYIRTSARAQYINPENDQDFSPFFSHVPRLDFDPTVANNFATRQDLNLGVARVFNFDDDFNRVPASSDSSASTLWSFGFNAGAQQRFRNPAPQSYALFFAPSAAYVIS
jgi:hypothetical protein